MSDLSWKLKQWFRKALPFAVVGALVWGAYTLHKRGTFRYGFKPAVMSVLRHVPFIGSKFRHWSGGQSRPSFTYRGRAVRKHRAFRGRHYRRRH